MNDMPTESTRLSVPLPFSPFYCPFVTTPAPLHHPHIGAEREASRRAVVSRGARGSRRGGQAGTLRHEIEFTPPRAYAKIASGVFVP